jgi:protein-S-isoprenylcysteine O-methyltransferase Ste14
MLNAMTLGAMLFTLNPGVVVLGAASIAVHHRIIRAEEAHLERELGEAHRSYLASVGRYVGVCR